MENVGHDRGVFLLELAQHLFDQHPVRGIIVGAFGLSHAGDAELLGQTHHRLLARVGQRTDDRDLTAEKLLFAFHRTYFAAVKLVQKDRFDNVIHMMPEGDLVETFLAGQ